MIYTTRAIIISTTAYTDNSLIIKAYTEEFGLQSYILRAARKKGGNAKPQHFQALRVVELEISQTPKAKLSSIRSSQLAGSYEHITTDIVKTTLALFLTEVINLSVKESVPNKELFHLLASETSALEAAPAKDTTEFHLRFLVKLASVLGFCPQDNYDAAHPYFNLRTGAFVATMQESDTLNQETSMSLHKLLSNPTERITRTLAERRELLNNLLHFYAIHITAGKPIRSHEILYTILG